MILGGIILLTVCLTGYIISKEVLNPDFKETKIYPDENRTAPADPTINANGIDIKMIGIKEG